MEVPSKTEGLAEKKEPKQRQATEERGELLSNDGEPILFFALGWQTMQSQFLTVMSMRVL